MMERISSRQLVLIGIAFTMDATLISLPNQIIDAAGMAGWLSYISAMLIILISIWLLSKVARRFPDKDLFEAMIAGFPYLGKLFALAYVLFFFIILARDIRMVTDFCNILLLPFTPVVVIALLISVTIGMIARGGVEILSRMTEIWLPVFLLIIFMIPLILVKEFDLRFMKPLFENGPVSVFEGGWYAVAYLGEIVALPLLFANSTFKFQTGLKALAIGTGTLLLHFYIVLTLGTHIPARVLYPTYEMVRQIKVTDFLDRFDLPLVGVYLPSMLTKVAYSLYIVCHGLKRVFPGLSAKHSVMPFAALSFVCSFWFFSNGIQLLRMNRTWPAFALIFELFLPILFFILLRNRMKKNKPVLN
jgi:spore germination protein